MAKLISWCKEHNREIILQEWTGINSENNSVDINNITHGSGINMQWKCKNGHRWNTSIVHRTLNGSNCPECNNYGTSIPEQFIYLALKSIYKDAESRCVVLKTPENKRGVEFDIGIPSIPLCIEYSPTGWHKNSIERDKLKHSICKEHNINFMYIIDDTYNELNETFDENLIIIKLSNNYNKKLQQLIKIVEHILNIYYAEKYEINYSEIMKEAEDICSNIREEESLAYNYPELANELIDYNPRIIKPASNKILKWKCTNCKSEFEAMVYDRAIKKHGCKFCGYNWNTKNIHKYASQKVIKGVNDLDTICKQLSLEWNTELNIKKPSEVKPNSHIRPYWTCLKCGYGSNGEWQSPLNNRYSKKQGCPKCKYNWYKSKS